MIQTVILVKDEESEPCESCGTLTREGIMFTTNLDDDEAVIINLCEPCVQWLHDVICSSNGHRLAQPFGSSFPELDLN